MDNLKVEDYDNVMAFTSRLRALYLYEYFRKINIQTKLVSAPNKNNISCTQALKFKATDKAKIKIGLEKNNIYPTVVYKIVRDGKFENYEVSE